MHKSAGGRIVPTAQVSVLDTHAGSTQIYAGNAHLTVGPSGFNAHHLHNLCSSQHRTSLVSFTYSQETAQRFALNASDVGWVYETDTDLLTKADIPFSDQKDGILNNHEHEVRINLLGLSELPQDLVISAVQVHRD